MAGSSQRSVKPGDRTPRAARAAAPVSVRVLVVPAVTPVTETPPIRSGVPGAATRTSITAPCGEAAKASRANAAAASSNARAMP